MKRRVGRKKREDGLGIRISLKQLGIWGGSIAAIAAGWVVLSNVYGQIGKTAHVLQVESKALAEIVRVEAKADVTALNVRLMQIKASLDGYRVVCGVDFKKCPTERDTTRVNELLKDQLDADEELRELQREQKQQQRK